MDWKQLVQFALQGSSDLEQLSPAARNLFTTRSLRPKSRFPN
jgi:hypothetical protein